MNQKICISKTNTYIGVLIFLIGIVVLLSRLALQNNQTSNSRASGTKSVAVELVPTGIPPSLEEQNTNKVSISLDKTGNIEIIGKAPRVVEGKRYSLYMSKNGIFTHIETFVATQKTMDEKYSTFWTPTYLVSANDIQQNAVFYLFEAK